MFPLAHVIVEDHYLEIHKETNNSSLYFLDNARKAIKSAFSIVGNCPELPKTPQMKKGKVAGMLIVDHNMHQALSEFAISE